MDYNSLPNFYAALDAKYNVTNNELNSATYTNVDCNFVYSAKYARHRWFNYKEGFSPILVEKIFNEYKLNKSSVVCDPFCGAGTTVAVAKAKGMKSIGFEVNPFAAFITKVKTENYFYCENGLFQEEVIDVEYSNLPQKLNCRQKVGLYDVSRRIMRGISNLFCSRESKRACLLKINLILMKAN